MLIVLFPITLSINPWKYPLNIISSGKANNISHKILNIYKLFHLNVPLYPLIANVVDIIAIENIIVKITFLIITFKLILLLILNTSLIFPKDLTIKIIGNTWIIP